MPEFSGDFLAAAVVFTIIGFIVLLYSGDCLVRGALAAAHKANVAPLLVGIVIVGFGTSLPELLIAIQGSSLGRFGLAHGNIVGSNIANIWLVVAAPAIIFPITTIAPRMRAMTVFMVLATIAWIVVTLLWGLNFIVGAAFLVALVAGLILAWSFGHVDRSEDTPEEKRLGAMASWRMIMLILLGVVGLPLGSRLLIEGGLGIAKSTAMSEEIVGLTLLAVGTSLPELGAGLAAAWRKQSEVAMGNILGSNIFNILGVGGVVAMFGQQTLSNEFHDYSHLAMLISALMIAFVILVGRRVGALTAGVFLGSYALYIAGLVQGWSFPTLRLALAAGG